MHSLKNLKSKTLGYSDKGIRQSGYSDKGIRKSGYSDKGIRKSGYSDKGIRKSGNSDKGIRKSGYSDKGIRKSQLVIQTRGVICRLCNKIYPFSAFKDLIPSRKYIIVCIFSENV